MSWVNQKFSLFSLSRGQGEKKKEKGQYISGHFVTNHLSLIND